MNQHAGGEHEIEVGTRIGNFKCRGLAQLGSGQPGAGPLERVALNLDAMQVRKTHLPQQQQLIAEVATDFENTCAERNTLQAALIDRGARDAVVALRSE